MSSEALVCSKCRRDWIPDPRARVTKVFKMCTSCRESNKKSREKNRCPHGKRKERCRDCGGSQICEHGKIKDACRDCGGSLICEHDKVRSRCKACNPLGNLRLRLRNRFREAFLRVPYNPQLKWIDYLGCTLSEIAKRFEREVLPSQRDDYSVDHIKPVSKFDLTDENEIKRCFHHTNIQFIPLTTNIQKGSNWTVEDEEHWVWNILAPSLRPRVDIVFCDECEAEIEDE